VTAKAKGSSGSGRRPGSPAKRRRRLRSVLFGFTVLLLLALIPVGIGGWSWLKLIRPYQGYVGSERLVLIAPGSGVSQILQQLQQEGVLEDAKLARSYLLYVMRNPRLKAGAYRFQGPMTAKEVLRKLVKGDVVRETVTLREGLTLEETADVLVAAKVGRREVFLERMRSPQAIADLDPEATDLEGYLFPETYIFDYGTDEKTIVDTLVRTFRERYEKAVRPILAAHEAGSSGSARGRTMRQVLTLASIVEKEAKVDSERPLIAAVYANRLADRIGLAADPTIIFALKRQGRWNGNLRRQDLQMDSPYNTYRYAGLPPGPICSPGVASLKAAAAPAAVPYLYFVGRNDGTHVFAETLAEHNRNVEIWQRQYWRDRRAQERSRRVPRAG
jgi:UPF0755 protein